MGQKGHGKRRGLYLFLWTRKRKSSNGNKIFVHHRIVSPVKRVEFVGDSISYIVLRGHWRNIIILNEHAPTEEKTDDSKYSFYKELHQVFDHFPKCHIKIKEAGYFQTDNWE